MSKRSRATGTNRDGRKGYSSDRLKSVPNWSANTRKPTPHSRIADALSAAPVLKPNRR